jgi:hypothetical protein
MHKRWLEHAAFALRADLEHIMFVILSFRDFWTRISMKQSERIKRIESKNIGRLTWLTAIFLPLSFGAELLGMQFRLSELGFILYDYLGLVVCCGLFLFVLYKVVPFLAFGIPIHWPRRSNQRRKPAILLTSRFLRTQWLYLIAGVVYGWRASISSF